MKINPKNKGLLVLLIAIALAFLSWLAVQLAG